MIESHKRIRELEQTIVKYLVSFRHPYVRQNHDCIYVDFHEPGYLDVTELATEIDKYTTE